jgi:hypothetical protein
MQDRCFAPKRARFRIPFDYFTALMCFSAYGAIGSSVTRAITFCLYALMNLNRPGLLRNLPG